MHRAPCSKCAAGGHQPRVVFTSSVAVYGGALPDVVQDDTALNPQSSYGAEKAIAELLLCDYARRGFVDGVTFALGQPSLDEVFLALTGHKADESTTDTRELEGSLA